MPAPRTALAAWHFAAGAIDRLLPPWQDVRVESNEPLSEGSKTVLALKVGPTRVRWIAQHERVDPEAGFTDRSLQGPFASWVHTHSFMDAAANESILRDHVQYALPLAPMSEFIFGGKVRRDLAQMFAFRHRRTRNDLVRHERYAKRPRRTIAVSGATGAVGRALCAFLTTGGHKVIRLVRAHPVVGSSDVLWNPTGQWDASRLEGIDAVVHLAGANIAQGRWTEARKKIILDSRAVSTKNLSEALARLARPPAVLVSASGVGFYGNRIDASLDESASTGDGFLASVTRAWEEGVLPAQLRGIRTVRMRIGVVVNAGTGVLARLKLPFQMGAGGPVGSGRQGMSWIQLDDLIAAIHFVIEEQQISGAVNTCAPNPVPQIEFARALARALRRPCIAPLPAPIVRLIFGQMGDELLLTGQFARPAVLNSHGFTFHFPSIDEAMQFEFGRLVK